MVAAKKYRILEKYKGVGVLIKGAPKDLFDSFIFEARFTKQIERLNGPGCWTHHSGLASFA